MQLKAAFGICILDQVKAEILFADLDLQDVNFFDRHKPWAVKYNLEDKNMLTFFDSRFVSIRIYKLFFRRAYYFCHSSFYDFLVFVDS